MPLSAPPPPATTRPWEPDGRAPVRLVELGPTPPGLSQAVYHALAERMDAAQPDTVVLTSPAAPYLCLGWHQAYDAVLHRAEAARRGLPVLRRRVGGGATYLDGDQLFYQFVFHAARLPANFRRVYAHLLAAPIAALRGAGLDAALHDVNEVEVEGVRVAGIGGGVIGEAAVVVGNYLLDFDYATMTAVWQAPWPAFRQVAGAALRTHVAGLRRWRPADTLADWRARLVAALPAALGRPVVPGPLTADEQAHAERIAARLSHPDWLALHSEQGPAPRRALKISARAHVYGLEGRLPAGLARTPAEAGAPVRVTLGLVNGTVGTARVELAPDGARHAAAEAALHGLELAQAGAWVQAQEATRPGAPTGR